MYICACAEKRVKILANCDNGTPLPLALDDLRYSVTNPCLIESVRSQALQRRNRGRGDKSFQ
jgi:hypothetical protein